MIVSALPLRKFLPRQNMGVDLTPKRFANARKETCHSAQSDRANHHQVHIALRARVFPRQGTENKRKLDPGLPEGRAKNICKSRGFQNKVSQIRVNRAVPGSLVIKSISIPARRNQARLDHPCHFQLHRPEGEFGLPSQFPEVKLPQVNPKQQPEDLGFTLGGDNIKQCEHTVCFKHTIV
jgi:hypothetical protein